MRAGGAARDVVARARANGVPANELEGGNLEVPGESVTDPVAYTLALSAEAVRQGAILLTGHRVVAIDRGPTVRSDAGAAIRCGAVVNCAGLYADDVARLAGDDSFAIFPRKGEFLVFDPPGGRPLDRILLPVPTTRTKGVLVFPTIDGRVITGPTAVDLEDKQDWSVRPEARAEILPKAVSMYPELDGAEPIAAYAGLRPAGRGVNYLIRQSGARPWLVNVAAIRSTGLTASLGIAEHVAGIVASLGVKLGDRARLIGGEPPEVGEPWWRRTAEFRGVSA
jgi:glycerol-3-phosphate dehydrogenase